jgi:hypothetical protein
MLRKIDYPFDNNILLADALEIEGYKAFVDPFNGKVSPQWQQKFNISDYAQIISDHWKEILQVENRPRFYIQKEGFTVPWHKDRGTKVAINFVLSGFKSPIEFRNGPVEYTVAMIDVQKEHRVTASNGKRILFKLSIFDIDYDTACKRYDKYQKDKLLEFGT